MTPRWSFLVVAFLFPLLLISSIARAAKIDPVEGLELARRGLTGMKDFTADLTQEKQIALLKKKLVSNGTVRFRYPDTFFILINPPFASRILLRDNVLVTVLPTENIRQKTVLPKDEGLLHWFTLLEKPVTKTPEGMNVRADRKDGGIVLTLVPTAPRGMKELQVSLHEDGRPRRLVIEEQNGDRTVMTFRNVKRNVGLTEKDFRID